MKKPGLSVSRVGLTVKELLFAFPGHLGVFLSVFPAGTARALAGSPELLPVFVPARTEAELAIAPMIAARWEIDLSAGGVSPDYFEKLHLERVQKARQNLRNLMRSSNPAGVGDDCDMRG